MLRLLQIDFDRALNRAIPEEGRQSLGRRGKRSEAKSQPRWIPFLL
jgi:hypothetical protein